MPLRSAMRSNTSRVRSSGSRVRPNRMKPACTSCAGTAVPIALMYGLIMRARLTASTALRPPKAKELLSAT